MFMLLPLLYFCLDLKLVSGQSINDKFHFRFKCIVLFLLLTYAIFIYLIISITKNLHYCPGKLVDNSINKAKFCIICYCSHLVYFHLFNSNMLPSFHYLQSLPNDSFHVLPQFLLKVIGFS